ncbi:hypothetical protein [uncultured Chryseobacterium sp.]|uniref:hypothetical protein n=1 Tax=uncultured Chryseobacterium sp. TaxID=259322 RepID=UPI0025FC4336|nr:hypothetical protein [uncultured Chryseobacterium sp.]
MAYKILYIEDLEAETRNLTFERENFNITSLPPSDNIDLIINDIKTVNPDLVLLDYILTEGSNLKYCNAPSIASTLRSLTAVEGLKERPIVLMSNKDNIVNSYRKDYTSHDLFDYAITKDNATKKYTQKFINKCIAFVKAYRKILEVKFDLPKILEIEENLIHSKLFIYLNDSNQSVYEYSRFIFEHVIRCSGLLIGEDILSARLGVSKESNNWVKLIEEISDCKYKGVFSEVYNRWWMSKIDNWWMLKIDEKYSLRHFNAEERVKKINEKTGLDLNVVTSSDKNLSSNYWTICKHTKLPLDPFDGIELLEEDFKPWQDKDYISIDGYLDDIDIYSKIISDLDRKEMRKYL